MLHDNIIIFALIQKVFLNGEHISFLNLFFYSIYSSFMTTLHTKYTFLARWTGSKGICVDNQ